ncbi:hypothetical protein B0H19DRAFT_1275010 [Mycena capillaripes]|nr:hypothetical protein B0H19DRAFT_1275010 [Mycena capillaripes]
MLTAYPELGFCDGMWKLDLLGSLNYTWWYKSYQSRRAKREAASLSSSDSDDSDNEFDADDEPDADSKTGPRSKKAKTKTTTTPDGSNR